MVDATRAMLDELMGRDRDIPLEERTGEGLQYTDPEICKHALAGLCPYGLFKNTRSDLGPCKFEIHNDDLQFEALKEEYDDLPQKEKDRLGYEKDLFGILTQLVRDMDRKIERQKDRAAKESAPRPATATEQATLDAIKDQEKEAMVLSEKLAEDGDVDGSMAKMAEAEGLQAKWKELFDSYTQPDRTMSVCEICGVFVQSTDNEQRRLVSDSSVQEHVQGKQYLGWSAIRDKLQELQGTWGQKEPERHRSKDMDRERDRHREKEREPVRSREADRDRERHRDSNRDRGRDRPREEERRRHRDYDDRDRRDRHRGSSRRSRSPAGRQGAEIPPGGAYDKSNGRQRERDRF